MGADTVYRNVLSVSAAGPQLCAATRAATEDGAPAKGHFTHGSGDRAALVLTLVGPRSSNQRDRAKYQIWSRTQI